MLKPITEEEKLQFTLNLQAEKAVEEMLAEIYYSGYNGYVDIWPVLKKEKGKVVMELSLKKLGTSGAVKITDENAVRYHVVQNKGYLRVSK
jgi:hypothetical protein